MSFNIDRLVDVSISQVAGDMSRRLRKEYWKTIEGIDTYVLPDPDTKDDTKDDTCVMKLYGSSDQTGASLTFLSNGGDPSKEEQDAFKNAFSEDVTPIVRSLEVIGHNKICLGIVMNKTDGTTYDPHSKPENYTLYKTGSNELISHNYKSTLEKELPFTQDLIRLSSVVINPVQTPVIKPNKPTDDNNGNNGSDEDGENDGENDEEDESDEGDEGDEDGENDEEDESDEGDEGDESDEGDEGTESDKGNDVSNGRSGDWYRNRFFSRSPRQPPFQVVSEATPDQLSINVIPEATSERLSTETIILLIILGLILLAGLGYLAYTFYLKSTIPTTIPDITAPIKPTIKTTTNIPEASPIPK